MLLIVDLMRSHAQVIIKSGRHQWKVFKRPYGQSSLFMLCPLRRILYLFFMSIKTCFIFECVIAVKSIGVYLFSLKRITRYPAYEIYFGASVK